MLSKSRQAYFVRPLRTVSVALLLGLSGGCSTLGYYAQSIDGHLELMGRSRPIERALRDERLDSATKARLKLARRARRYASEVLGLPDNDSYTSYADLGRSYAVWNVIATDPLSVEPRQWCFLFVGCIQYRGYFDKARAEAYADTLRAQGMDTYVAGARAYSTLGWFDDPLLNTMIRQPEARLVGIIFHELAHQVLYVPDDTAFNEAFATTVEREGLRRWYRDRQRPEDFRAYLQSEQHRHEFHDLLLETRAKLQAVYASEQSPTHKRAAKARIFAQLQARYQRWKRQAGYEGYDQWMSQPLNNAHLALVATYNDLVPHFHGLLSRLRYDLPDFYAVAAEYAKLPRAERHRRLEAHQPKGTDYARELPAAGD